MKRLVAALLAVVVIALSACSPNAADKKGSSAALKVFATTGYLGDAVARIAPDADVTVMVKPGGDPHTYQPSTKDVEKLRDADLVIWNGLYLEAMMEDQLRSLGDKQLAVGEKIDQSKLLPWPEKDHDGNDLYDPHIWNSPDIWSDVVDQIATRLSEAQPDNAETFAANAKAFKDEIAKLKTETKAKLAAIPAAQRHLITGHDAFQYYGAVFKLDIRATDFVTSESQLSAAELDELASFIADKKIPTIFQDNLKNPQAITSLKEAVRAKGWEVEVSDKELFADSLGDHSPVDTYLGVIEHNTNAIVAGLTGK
ncbi:manganese/zinc/iron transport system substrate-binding protein [Bowdeniella nasicola]|uniref:Manganese/zinc/iron transport system substrate-binding protein n=1 Tax=Bowdeniella nasicola TaxID=208480 RepID=A0A1H3YBD2_9ACTO|nr:metal ABC transporter substrate-binding protein [Bowdeniella nasicola]SEA08301.1 manganese/zinc/iron transport system substrate-binding protein [Bowdeniella nasicola]